ncbi:Arsenite methyltransferase [Smittium mucronatum]|uniref:Arsenite methyltransferase n=1 Tax=Smittium mucronatum TaxID=133383 RepID=A0A1R0H4R4_9FUNG|nr:Arsenite methyltransferase [Smittium mucronatum]
MAPKHFAPVWKYFERNVPVGKSKHHRAQCIYCGYELSGQPERMRTHLRKCLKISSNERKFILRDIADDSETIDSNSKLDFSNSPSQNNIAESRSIEEQDYSGFSCGINPAITNKFAESKSALNSNNNPLKRHRNDSTCLPGSVQGLLGFPWDRTVRSYMGHNRESDTEIYNKIRSYYSDLKYSDKRQTSIVNKIAPHPIIKSAISLVPKQVSENYRGCGTPIPMGIEGLRVLDLGCGSGRDCYIVSKLVGPTGQVTGIDMTEEVLHIAREHLSEYSDKLGYNPHLKFVKGYIEFLNDAGIYPESIDLCISNSAVNLSPNKKLVFQSVFEILREGGEFYFSDIYADRRLPNHLRSHPTLLTECLGGALYIEDFKRLCEQVGFNDPRQVGPAVPVRIESPELRDLVNTTQFYSITYRMFKHTKPTTTLEPTREDYGQTAVYKGTIEGQRSRIRLDNDWCFETNKTVLVDGNTATILSDSWLQRHFEVRGERSCHFGRFINNVPSKIQYDAWELENEENIFYNSLISVKSPFEGIGSALVRSNNSFNQNDINNYNNSTFDINQSFEFENTSNPVNNSFFIDRNNTHQSQRPDLQNGFYSSNTNFPPPVTIHEPVPTFIISKRNFAGNQHSNSASTSPKINGSVSLNKDDRENSLNRYVPYSPAGHFPSSFSLDRDLHHSTIGDVLNNGGHSKVSFGNFNKRDNHFSPKKNVDSFSHISDYRTSKMLITYHDEHLSSSDQQNHDPNTNPIILDRNNLGRINMAKENVDGFPESLSLNNVNTNEKFKSLGFKGYIHKGSEATDINRRRGSMPGRDSETSKISRSDNSKVINNRDGNIVDNNSYSSPGNIEIDNDNLEDIINLARSLNNHSEPEKNHTADSNKIFPFKHNLKSDYVMRNSNYFDHDPNAENINSKKLQSFSSEPLSSIEKNPMAASGNSRGVPSPHYSQKEIESPTTVQNSISSFSIKHSKLTSDPKDS